MTYQHAHLALGSWQKLTLVEQLANIGSEVIRAMNWKTKKNTNYSQQASARAFELLSLSFEGKRTGTELKELARLKELLADYFYGDNSYHSNQDSWERYFMAFTVAARQNR